MSQARDIQSRAYSDFSPYSAFYHWGSTKLLETAVRITKVRSLKHLVNKTILLKPFYSCESSWVRCESAALFVLEQQHNKNCALECCDRVSHENIIHLRFSTNLIMMYQIMYHQGGKNSFPGSATTSTPSTPDSSKRKPYFTGKKLTL